MEKKQLEVQIDRIINWLWWI